MSASSPILLYCKPYKQAIFQTVESHVVLLCTLERGHFSIETASFGPRQQRLKTGFTESGRYMLHEGGGGEKNEALTTLVAWIPRTLTCKFSDQKKNCLMHMQSKGIRFVGLHFLGNRGLTNPQQRRTSTHQPHKYLRSS